MQGEKGLLEFLAIGDYGKDSNIKFVPSYDEDLGLITCGNAIIYGSTPKVKFTELI